jgi:hypothetical protein
MMTFLTLWLLRFDTNDPKTIHVVNWLSGRDLGVATDMGSYPIGTTLTDTIAWDKANHQFVSVVKVKGETGEAMRVVVPYSVSDTTPPARPVRWLDEGQIAQVAPALTHSYRSRLFTTT